MSLSVFVILLLIVCLSLHVCVSQCVSLRRVCLSVCVHALPYVCVSECVSGSLSVCVFVCVCLSQCAQGIKQPGEQGSSCMELLSTLNHDM